MMKIENPCECCREREAVVDDFGIIACQKCLDARPELKRYLNKMGKEEAEQFGYND